MGKKNSEPTPSPLARHCDEIAKAWHVLNYQEKTPAISDALAIIMESGKAIRAGVKTLEEENAELIDSGKRLMDQRAELEVKVEELENAGEIDDPDILTVHETDYLNISTKNQHGEDIAEALTEALRHGRIHHLNDYLRAYVPDVKAYHN